jgi:regulatory protein
VEIGIRFLARGRRFEREIRTHLRKKGVAAGEIDAAIVRLKELSLVDDAETARAWVRDRLRFAPKGRGLLRAQLLKKGVAREIADEATAGDAEDAAAEIEIAAALARKLAARGSSADPGALRRRLWAGLARRGFDPPTCREAIARALGDDAAADRDVIDAADGETMDEENA